MKRGILADHFSGAGVKRLSRVDADPIRSNQHEIGTTREMRDDFLGEIHNEKLNTIYIWLGDEQEALTETGSVTHYNARHNKSERSPEWRLYYKSNSITENMKEGDTLFLAKHHNGSLLFIVTPQDSTSEQQLLWLFDLRPPKKNFISQKISNDAPRLDFAARYILDELGIEFEDPAANGLDNIIERFGTIFPKTQTLSDLARQTLPHVRAEDDPDAALVAWLEHEEALFRRLERRIVAERLEQGFMTQEGADVDGFISFSLSVQNRRKSRMGHSLENHIAAVLDCHHLEYERGARTEHGQKPDFLFPSAIAYKAACPEDPTLLMLGAKSTCKDRWRQILAEADKIPHKHLLTIQPGITENQTIQMKHSDLQLVVPTPIQETFTERQRKEHLLSFDDFIKEAKQRNHTHNHKNRL